MAYRVVLDTNVFVSAVLWRGTPSRIAHSLEQGSIGTVLTPSVIEEFRRVLERPEFTAILVRRHTSASKLIRELLSRSIVVPDRASPVPIPADPSDEKFLAAAITARADAIVSGDRHLIDLGMVDGIPILTPRQFFDWFTTGSSEPDPSASD